MKKRAGKGEGLVDDLVKYCQSNESHPRLFLDQVLSNIRESRELQKHVHSVRFRIKDSEHLRDKLMRKIRKHQGRLSSFPINRENIFEKITDSAGVRIIHLHTKQFEVINSCLRKIIEDQNFKLVEGPFARTWDDESRRYFRALGVETQDSPSLYTSVHYVIGSASRIFVTCEIQVRTLMEEVWGEVDHAINYPIPINSVACAEQIRALARVTSGASRLVDSIFASYRDLEEQAGEEKSNQSKKEQDLLAST